MHTTLPMEFTSLEIKEVLVEFLPRCTYCKVLVWSSVHELVKVTVICWLLCCDNSLKSAEKVSGLEINT